MPEGLTFTINPEAKTTSIDLFAKALNDIGKLLDEVDYAIYRDRSSKRWVVSNLHSSAPTVTVKPLLGDQEAVNIVADGLRSVTAGSFEPPEYFGEDVLASLKRMRRLFVGRDHARSIVVSADRQRIATIEKEIGEQTDQILRAGYWNLASIEGTLEVVSVHRSNSFTMWDRISNSPVKCSIPSASTMIEEAKELLGKRVIVRGKVRYFSNGVPRAIADVLEIADATPDPDLPKAGFGSIPDMEAARDPVSFLREVREREE